MHRVFNIKHRIVRRVDVALAPLATFDNFDLGDEDIKDSKRNNNNNVSSKCVNKLDNLSKSGSEKKLSCDVGVVKSGIIGGNNSKKALAQTGGEGGDEHADRPQKDRDDNNESASNAAGEVKTSPVTSTLVPDKICDEKVGKTVEEGEDKQLSKKTDPRVDFDTEKPKAYPVHAVTSSLTRQGTLGRVTIPIKKQSSVSSSSSSEACNDSHFTFTTSRPSIAHLDSADGGSDLPDSPASKSSVSNLVPDNIDPRQILSPSKRKAYEKRLERLKVTTSPIARPRSNAPINVVTLDDYANLSSPESSPVSHSILHDKLKITLPSDEFHKSSKVSGSRRKSEVDTCFEFSEEILFRCTKSALVVDEDGHLPLSPRRVLIPPTITPTNSPKLSSSPNINSDSVSDIPPPHNAPKLIYMKEDDPTHNFFGLTIDHTENDNWADFTDNSLDCEKADTEISEKEKLNSALAECPDKDSHDDLVIGIESTDKESKKCDDSISDNLHDDEVTCIPTAEEKLEGSPSYLEPKLVSEETNFNDSNAPLDFSSLDTVNIGGVESEQQISEPELNPLEQAEDPKAPVTELDVNSCEAVALSIPPSDTSYDNTDNNTNQLIPAESISNSNDNVLIRPSNPFTDFENSTTNISNPVCGEVISSEPDTCTSNTHLDDPFNLFDLPSNQTNNNSSIPLLPASFTPALLSSNLDSLQTESSSISSVSLNPFLDLQDTPIPSLSDSTDTNNADQSCVLGNRQTNLPPPSPENQLCVGSNLTATHSSSSSTDLIDFSSSLEMDLPPSE